jgi:uncharacterized protein YndB with AHSA1/START domain
VFTNVPVDADNHALMAGLTTVTFEEVGGQTEITVHTVATTMVDRALPMIEGMKQGWEMTVDKLGEFISSAVGKG